MSETNEPRLPRQINIHRDHKHEAAMASARAILPDHVKGTKATEQAYLQGFYAGHLAATVYRLYEDEESAEVDEMAARRQAEADAELEGRDR